MQNPEYARVVEEERKAALRKNEILVQGLIAAEVLGSDERFMTEWIDNGCAALFRNLVEGEQPDDALVDIVLHQPDKRSPEATEWAHRVYEYVHQAQEQRHAA